MASGHRWKAPPHILLLNNKLKGVAAGRIKRLMVWLPPRHGKSEFCSKYFSPWYLGLFPDNRVILTSYESDFAAEWGRVGRDLMEEFGPSIFGVNVSPASSAANRWDIDGHLGGMKTAGVGGPITGKGAHVFIIDDPIKNDEEALSATHREKQWNWYRSTAYSRLEPGGAIIIIQTRWHEDDLSGRLVEESKSGGDAWDIVDLPAIAGQDDPLGRQEGEALWPQRYPIESLEQKKRVMGAYWFSALFQQRPAPDEGMVFLRHWWKYWENYEALPEFEEIILSWDCSFKDKVTSDYVAGQVWGKYKANRYLLDQFRAKMNFPTTVSAIKNLKAKWPMASAILIEDKANGTAVIDTLKDEIPGIIPIEPQGGKVVRAHAVTAQIESGNVYIPNPSKYKWAADFIEECAAFPNGKNDDQVDSMTQALTRLGKSGFRAAWADRPDWA